MAKESTSPASAELGASLGGMSFEAAVAELEVIVRRLETGQGELATSIADYTRGMALKDHCLQKLDAAKLQLDTLMKNTDGTMSIQSGNLPE